MLEGLLSTLFSIIWYGGILLTVVLKMLYYSQNKMLYDPETPSPENKYQEMNPQGFRSPSEHKIDFEDVAVITEDQVKLRGWLIKQPDPQKRETIIYFHENAGNIGFRIPNIQRIHENEKLTYLLSDIEAMGIVKELQLSRDLNLMPLLFLIGHLVIHKLTTRKSLSLEGL